MPEYSANASVFHPLSPAASAISALFTGTLIFLGVILALVTLLVIWFAFRFRDQPGAREPLQIYGWTALEIAWTVVPAACLMVLFIFMAITMHRSDPSPGTRSPDLIVIAHQWWWEVDYMQSGVVAANEIHIPASKRLLLELRSSDVIHDFWVPQLARKVDVVPGHPNHLWLEASVPGTYLGACAEFCGTEHAWMRIFIVAQAEPDFEQWERQQLKVPQPPSSEEASKGAAVFQKRTCANCHTIEGTAANQRIGPDLTHLAGRGVLAAGAAENTPADLSLWLKNPDAFKPGSHMPNLKLSNDEVQALVSYLETLK